MEQRIRVRTSIIKATIYLLLGLAYYAFVRITGWGIPCLFSLATGIVCPGCGISRMFIALLQLDFRAAFGYNALVLCALPFVLIFGFRHWLRWVKTGNSEMDGLEKVLVLIAAALTIAFWIMRNMEEYAFLAP